MSRIVDDHIDVTLSKTAAEKIGVYSFSGNAQDFVEVINIVDAAIEGIEDKNQGMNVVPVEFGNEGGTDAE